MVRDYQSTPDTFTSIEDVDRLIADGKIEQKDLRSILITMVIDRGLTSDTGKLGEVLSFLDRKTDEGFINNDFKESFLKGLAKILVDDAIRKVNISASYDHNSTVKIIATLRYKLSEYPLLLKMALEYNKKMIEQEIEAQKTALLSLEQSLQATKEALRPLE